MKKLLLLFLILGVAAVGATAQVSITNTTTTSAVSASATLVPVTSATGFVASTTIAVVDFEIMSITAVNSTNITVIRGQGGTKQVPHISGARVWVGPQNYFYSFTPPNGSACTATLEVALPHINPVAQTISQCSGGVWLGGGANAAPPYKVLSPNPGGTAYTSINTNGTAGAATTMFCTELNLPVPKLLTNLEVLLGTTVGTDKLILALYPGAGGSALAWTALAGTTTGTASTYQAIALVTNYYAVAGDYFVCVQDNGSTDTLRMVVTGVNDQILTKGQTSSTFGTLPTLTAPTSFTTAVGPYVGVN